MTSDQMGLSARDSSPSMREVTPKKQTPSVDGTSVKSEQRARLTPVSEDWDGG